LTSQGIILNTLKRVTRQVPSRNEFRTYEYSHDAKPKKYSFTLGASGHWLGTRTGASVIASFKLYCPQFMASWTAGTPSCCPFQVKDH
jgi:hypothetical protein